MTFILIPSRGEDFRVNAWNWRPTLELLRAANVITEEDHERMGAQGCGGEADAEKASRLADVITETHGHGSKRASISESVVFESAKEVRRVRPWCECW